eukprot:941744_1
MVSEIVIYDIHSLIKLKSNGCHLFFGSACIRVARISIYRCSSSNHSEKMKCCTKCLMRFEKEDRKQQEIDRWVFRQNESDQKVTNDNHNNKSNNDVSHCEFYNIGRKSLRQYMK